MKAFRIVLTICTLIASVIVYGAQTMQDQSPQGNSYQLKSPATVIVPFDMGRCAYIGTRGGEIYLKSPKGLQLLVEGDSMHNAIEWIKLGGQDAQFRYSSGGQEYRFANGNAFLLPTQQTRNSSFTSTGTQRVKVTNGKDYIVENDQIRNKNNETVYSADGEITAVAKNTSGNTLLLGTAAATLTTITDTKSASAENSKVSSEFICKIPGTTKAIYRIKISALGLTSKEVFLHGINETYYKIDSSIDSTAQPILGFIYNTITSSSDKVISTRPLEYLAVGPQSDSAFDCTLTRYPTTIETDSQITFSAKPMDSTTYEDLNSSDNYSLELTYKSDNTCKLYNNGVCAAPFKVTIRKNGTALDATTYSEIYDRLVFYAATSGDTPDYETNLIGANPFDQNAKYYAVLPASSVEIDSSYLKYGQHFDDDGSEGKVFYLFAGPKQNGQNVKPQVGLFTVSTSGGTQTLNFKKSELKVAITSTSSSQGIAFSDLSADSSNSSVKLYASGSVSSIESPLISNWEGYNGKYAGYLDYYAQTEKINYYFPEGLSTRAFADRKDLSKMTVGFYIKPTTTSQETVDNPFVTSSASIDAFTSDSNDMRGKTVYVFLFDHMGRHAEFSYKDTDSRASDWGLNGKEQPIGIRLANCSTLYPVNFTAYSTTQKNENTGGAWTDHGIGSTGVIVGVSYRDTNAGVKYGTCYKFLTDRKSIVNDYTDGDYWIKGWNLLDWTKDVFEVKFSLWTGSSWGITYEVIPYINSNDGYVPITYIYIYNPTSGTAYRWNYFGVYYMPIKEAIAYSNQGALSNAGGEYWGISDTIWYQSTNDYPDFCTIGYLYKYDRNRGSTATDSMDKYVSYKLNSGSLWSTGTSNHPGATLAMQGDGNLVIYEAGHSGDPSYKLWASDTSGNPGAHDVMQSDGNYVILNKDGNPIWASGTAGNPGAHTLMQGDGNLVVYSYSNASDVGFFTKIAVDGPTQQ